MAIDTKKALNNAKNNATKIPEALLKLMPRDEKLKNLNPKKNKTDIK